MYQFYYRMHGIKKTEAFKTLEEVYVRANELCSDMETCPNLYAEVIGPDGTMIQKVSRCG